MGKLSTAFFVLLMACISAMAQENTGLETVTFDFTDPEGLTPSVVAPAVKDFVLLDGKTFTCGDVSVAFHATGNGNTQVRLYGSYDAGCNLRVYDGDSFVVSSSNPSKIIKEIAFDIALSGTTADVDLMPSAGEYEWLENRWTAGDEQVSSVTLTSIQQSRISTMTISLEDTDLSVVGEIGISDADVQWFDLRGMPVANPDTPGIYVRCQDGKAVKVKL